MQFDQSGNRVNVLHRFYYYIFRKFRRAIAIEELKWRGLPLPVNSLIKREGNSLWIVFESTVPQPYKEGFLYFDTWIQFS